MQDNTTQKNMADSRASVEERFSETKSVSLCSGCS